MEEIPAPTAAAVETSEVEDKAGEVDLNKVFQVEDLDLNQMFPDDDMRKFLQQLAKNRRANERFLEGFNKDKVWSRDE